MTNVSALFAAQNSALESTEFVYRMTVRNSTRPNFDIRIANGAGGTHAEYRVPSTDTRREWYFSSEEAGYYSGSSGTIEYGIGPARLATRSGFATGFLLVDREGYVSGLEWKTAGVYTTETGERRLVLGSNGRNESAPDVFAPSPVGDEETLKDVTGRIEVTAGGMVRYGNVSATVRRANGSVYTRGIDFTVGPLASGSVERPDWLSGVLTADLSVESDDRLLVYEYTGDRPVEAGTSLTVTLGGIAVPREVTLDESVAQGDTVHGHRTGEDENTTLTASVDQRPSLPDEATEFPPQVTVAVRPGNYEVKVGREAGTA